MVEEQINVDYTVNSTIFPISMVNSDIFVNFNALPPFIDWSYRDLFVKSLLSLRNQYCR